jgi:hypothetical protein
VKRVLATKRGSNEVDRFLCSIMFLRFIGPAIVDPSKYSIKLPDGVTERQLQKPSIEAVKLILRVINGLANSPERASQEKYLQLRNLVLENISVIVDPALIKRVEQGSQFIHTARSLVRLLILQQSKRRLTASNSAKARSNLRVLSCSSTSKATRRLTV